LSTLEQLLIMTNKCPLARVRVPGSSLPVDPGLYQVPLPVPLPVTVAPPGGPTGGRHGRARPRVVPCLATEWAALSRQGPRRPGPPPGRQPAAGGPNPGPAPAGPGPPGKPAAAPGGRSVRVTRPEQQVATAQLASRLTRQRSAFTFRRANHVDTSHWHWHHVRIARATP
jgi:hypothetical protein